MLRLEAGYLDPAQTPASGLYSPCVSYDNAPPYANTAVVRAGFCPSDYWVVTTLGEFAKAQFNTTYYHHSLWTPGHTGRDPAYVSNLVHENLCIKSVTSLTPSYNPTGTTADEKAGLDPNTLALVHLQDARSIFPLYIINRGYNVIESVTAKHNPTTYEIGGVEPPTFSPNEDYAKGDYVVQSGKIYRATTDVEASSFDSQEWEDLGTSHTLPKRQISYHPSTLKWINTVHPPGLAQATAFNTTTAYQAGDHVIHNEVVYTAKNTITAGSAFNAAQWEETFPDHDPEGNYSSGDYVTYKKRIWRAETSDAEEVLPDYTVPEGESAKWKLVGAQPFLGKGRPWEWKEVLDDLAARLPSLYDRSQGLGNAAVPALNTAGFYVPYQTPFSPASGDADDELDRRPQDLRFYSSNVWEAITTVLRATTHTIGVAPNNTFYVTPCSQATSAYNPTLEQRLSGQVLKNPNPAPTAQQLKDNALSPIYTRASYGPTMLPAAYRVVFPRHSPDGWGNHYPSDQDALFTNPYRNHLILIDEALAFVPGFDASAITSSTLVETIYADKHPFWTDNYTATNTSKEQTRQLAKVLANVAASKATGNHSSYTFAGIISWQPDQITPIIFYNLGSKPYTTFHHTTDTYFSLRDDLDDLLEPATPDLAPQTQPYFLSGNGTPQQPFLPFSKWVVGLVTEDVAADRIGVCDLLALRLEDTEPETLSEDNYDALVGDVVREGVPFYNWTGTALEVGSRVRMDWSHAEQVWVASSLGGGGGGTSTEDVLLVEALPGWEVVGQQAILPPAKALPVAQSVNQDGNLVRSWDWLAAFVRVFPQDGIVLDLTSTSGCGCGTTASVSAFSGITINSPIGPQGNNRLDDLDPSTSDTATITGRGVSPTATVTVTITDGSTTIVKSTDAATDSTPAATVTNNNDGTFTCNPQVFTSFARGYVKITATDGDSTFSMAIYYAKTYTQQQLNEAPPFPSTPTLDSSVTSDVTPTFSVTSALPASASGPVPDLLISGVSVATDEVAAISPVNFFVPGQIDQPLTPTSNLVDPTDLEDDKLVVRFVAQLGMYTEDAGFDRYAGPSNPLVFVIAYADYTAAQAAKTYGRFGPAETLGTYKILRDVNSCLGPELPPFLATRLEGGIVAKGTASSNFTQSNSSVSLEQNSVTIVNDGEATTPTTPTSFSQVTEQADRLVGSSGDTVYASYDAATTTWTLNWVVPAGA